MGEKALLYARISLDRTHEEVGVQRQLHDMRALAEARGYEVVEEITDNDISASKNLHRPGYEKIWALVRSGAIEHVVVWQSSRLMRSRKDRAEVISTFGQHHVDVVAVQGPSLDLRTAYGRGLADMMTSFDSMEGEVKAERVSAAIADLARRGKGWGYCPYGWDRVGRGVHAKQVINESEAAVVRAIVDRLLANESVNEIWRDLNRREVPSPGYSVWLKIPPETRLQREQFKGRKPPSKLWAKSTVRVLALRDANVAVRRYRHRVDGGVEMRADWPPIIGPDKHARVVALLKNPERRSHTGPRPGARKHLLTAGLGECGKCHGPLRVARRNGRRGNGSKVYMCETGGGCTGRLQEPVDNLVKRVAIARLAQPGALDMLLGDDKEAQQLQKHCAELQRRLDEAADSQADGKITIGQLERITARVEPRLAAAKQERDKALRSLDVDQLQPLIGPGASAAWDAMGVNQRRAVLTTIGLRAVVILPRKLHGPGFEADSVRFDWQ